jgi:hypothetical protein
MKWLDIKSLVEFVVVIVRGDIIVKFVAIEAEEMFLYVIIICL